MTQLGEAVAVALDVAAKHMKDACPFCCEHETESRKQDLENDPGKLRTACTAGDVLGMAEPVGENVWKTTYKHPESGIEASSEIRSNPHHLIPGNASLAGHDIMEAIDKEKGTITDDIGYDVNGRPNGIWLPTILEDFYAGKEAAPSSGIRWGKLSKKYPNEQFSMAEAAMWETRRQFHDAHTEYSVEVEIRLGKLLDTLRQAKIACPEAGPKGKPNVPPPYGLVQRLNGLSSHLATKLVGNPTRWKRPFYTSRHAIELADRLRSIRLAALLTQRGSK